MGVHRIYRKKELLELTGLKRTTIQEAIEAGTFPKPIPLGARSIGWLESEILAWQQARIAVRDEGRADRSGLSGTAKAHHLARLRAAEKGS
jgi:prophage regulatory protein